MSEAQGHIQETAEKLADGVLKAAGSGFQYYMPSSKEKIVAVVADFLLADRQRDQWRDISTAPKNSAEPYLCYSPGNPRAHNEYARDEHYHIDGFSERWPRGRNQYPEAPYTHWQPLPAAPKGK